MGEAPPHKNDLIGSAAGGVLKSVCLKLDTSFKIALFCFALILAPQLAARWQSGSWTRTSRLTIGWKDHPRLYKAVTPQNQQQTASALQHSFPVTSRSTKETMCSETKPQSFPSNKKNHVGRKELRQTFTWTQVTNKVYITELGIDLNAGKSTILFVIFLCGLSNEIECYLSTLTLELCMYVCVCVCVF